MIVYNNNSAWTAVYLGNQQISKVHSSQAKVWPEEPLSYKYSLYDANGDLVISGACDTSTTITQAEVINYQTSSVSADIGECCDTLGEGVFSGWTNLTSVTMSSAVQYIRPYAFRYCSNLVNVTFPDDLREIGHNAFHGCTSLVSVTLPSGLTSLGDMVFLDCSGLTSVNIPEGLSKIPQHTFNKCYSLSAMTIPSGITEIAYEAFYKCSGLTSVTVLATTPPTLGNSVFDFTTCQIFVPCESVEAYKSAPNWSNYASRIQAIAGSCHKVKMTYKNGDVLWTDCNSSSVVTWAEDINKPNHHVDDVVSVVIGDCVDAIGNAFDNATALTSVTLSDNITQFTGFCFSNCSSLTNIAYPPSLTLIGRLSFKGCAISAIDIPSSVTTLGTGCYYGCASATTLSIGSGVTSIPDSAFTQCTSLTSINIPNNITSIGVSSFAFCTGLTSVTIPSSVTSIDQRAFESCSALTSFTCMATTPPTLGYMAFYDTTTQIYVPSGSVEDYKAASRWSTYASRIQAIPTD